MSPLKLVGILAAAVVALGAAGAAWAAEPYKMPELTVEGELESTAERNVVVIDVENEVKSVTTSPVDLMNATPGVDVQQRGVLTPRNSQVRLRGLDEGRSLVLLDGRPLNGTGVMGGMYVDWTGMDMNSFSALEVSKGAFSAKYGNTLGGTINLSSLLPSTEPTATAFSGYSRYNTFNAGAKGSDTVGDFGAWVVADYLSTDGNIRNSEARRSNFSTSLQYKLGDGGLAKAGIRYTDGKFGLPVENNPSLAGYNPDWPKSIGTMVIGPGLAYPIGDRQGDDSYYEKERTELDLSLEKNILNFDTSLKLFYNHEHRKDVIYSYQEEKKVFERECKPDVSWGWIGRLARSVGSHKLGLGAEQRFQGYGGIQLKYVEPNFFRNKLLADGDTDDATRFQGLYVDDTWFILKNLDLYMGLRFDDFTGERTADQVISYVNGRPTGTERVSGTLGYDAWQPKLGLTYRPIEEMALFVRAAKAARFPNNPEVFWYYQGYRPEVDPSNDYVRQDLTYEDAWQYEAGVNFLGTENLAFSVSYFNYQIDDYIRMVQGYTSNILVYNIDKVEIYGVEVDVEGKIWGGFSGFANFTWQQTKKDGDVMDGSNALSDSLSELPEYKVNLGLRYQHDSGFMTKLTVRWVDTRQVPFIGDPYSTSGASYAGGTPLDTDVHLYDMDSYWALDLVARYPVLRDKYLLTLTGGVTNLLDEDWEEEYGLPQPGRSFFIGVEMGF